MKVNRRSASSPSLLLEASEPPTSVSEDPYYYQFELEAHHVEKGKRGQKVFVCDLCHPSSGIFKRSFSLKRHYLRFHINFAFLSPRDLNNCAIAPAGQQSRSGFPQSGVGNRLINRLSTSSPRLIYRCHQCGCLLQTKNDLLKHLETHPHVSPSGTNELINDEEHRGTNRCPRCSTAFSLRKTLMRHIKKNRCRGGGSNSGPQSKTESEISVHSEEISNSNDDDTTRREDESEEMDMEASLKLGCPTSLFRFACTLCAKMFNSYVNMCRHRRLAHGRYGICSPHWLLSRKLSGKPMINHSVPLPAMTNQGIQNSLDFSHFVQNANENLSRHLDGKKIHIKSIVAPEDMFETPEASDPPPERWSWKDPSYNLSELQKLDIPLQLAYDRGLKLWNLQEASKLQDQSSSQEDNENGDISLALSLRPAKLCSTNRIPINPRPTTPPELSGEWTRSKDYICLPCGRMYHDFLALLEHQQEDHTNVWCTHIQLDQTSGTELAAELTRQIQRSGSAASTHSSTTFQCTKCHLNVQSITELHSHIILCSNHVSTSPSRRRKSFKSNSSSRRNHWNRNESSGRSRGMQRTISSQTKTSSATRSLRSRSPKEETAIGDDASNNALRRSTRRVLSFQEQTSSKKKKNIVTKRVLRQRSNPSLAVVTTAVKVAKIKAMKKSSTPSRVPDDIYECDGCHKKFQSNTSVLKHKHYCPNKSNIDEISTPIPTLTYPTTNGHVKVRSKLDSKNPEKLKDKPKHQILKSRLLPTDSVSSPKAKSKTPVCSQPIDINKTPCVSPSTKKNKIKLDKNTTAAAKSKVTPLKTSSDKKSSKIKGKKARNIKTKRVMAKKTIKQETPEPEGVPTGTSGRPIRASRKSSMTLVMEDKVEASFLEALSPEQRVQVAEQKCPFCSKHYVYRSNFKKHLLEGCDTVDSNEVSISLTSAPEKPNGDLGTNGEQKQSRANKSQTTHRSSLKTAQFEHHEKSDSLHAKVLKSSDADKRKLAKKFSKLLETESPSSEGRNVISSNKLPPTTKEEVKKKSKKKLKKTMKRLVPEKNEPKRTKKLNTTKPSKEIPIKRKNGPISIRNSLEQPGKISCKPKNASKSKQTNPVENKTETDTHLEMKQEHVVNEVIRIPSQDPCEEDESIALWKNGSIKTPEDKTCCHTKNLVSENGIYKDRELGWAISDDNEILTSRTLNGEAKMSHALDRVYFGKALDDAIRTGIFKSYASLTKYPMEIQQLKAMAQAYCHTNKDQDDPKSSPTQLSSTQKNDICQQK